MTQAVRRILVPCLLWLVGLPLAGQTKSYTVLEDLSTSGGPVLVTAVKRVFPVAAVSQAVWPQHDVTSTSEYQKCQAYEAAGGTSDEYREYLRQELAARSQFSDPVRGYLLTCNGIHFLLKRQYDEALASFRPVVDGSVAARKVDRIIAMKRVSWIHHRRGDLLLAYQAYREVEEVSQSELVKAQVRVELAGILIEMAKGEGISPVPAQLRPKLFERARTLCQQVSNASEDAPPDRKMCADLMHFESFFLQNDFETAYREGCAFFRKWGWEAAAYPGRQTMRIYANTALGFHVQTCYVIGREEEARKLAERILATPDIAKNQFDAFDVYLRALAVAKVCAVESGNARKADEYAGLAARRNAGLFGTIESFLSAKRAKKHY